MCHAPLARDWQLEAWRLFSVVMETVLRQRPDQPRNSSAGWHRQPNHRDLTAFSESTYLLPFQIVQRAPSSASRRTREGAKLGGKYWRRCAGQRNQRAATPRKQSRPGVMQRASLAVAAFTDRSAGECTLQPKYSCSGIERDWHRP